MYFTSHKRLTATSRTERVRGWESSILVGSHPQTTTHQPSDPITHSVKTHPSPPNKGTMVGNFTLDIKLLNIIEIEGENLLTTEAACFMSDGSFQSYQKS